MKTTVKVNANQTSDDVSELVVITTSLVLMVGSFVTFIISNWN